MKRRLLHWVVLALLLSVLSAGAAVAVVYWRHTVPLSRCSEVYRRYHDLPGIQASFIKQVSVNDTLRLDMTIFQARDSASFANLLHHMGKSDEYIIGIKKAVVDNNTRFVGRCPKGHPELPRDPEDKNNDVMAIFPARNEVAFLHSNSYDEARDALISNIRKTFNF